MRGRLLYLCGGGGTDLAPAPWHRRADDDVWEAVD